jgi:LAO/AO transport system kinase
MRALFDMVIVETVGVGQSETEIEDVADTVVFCAQPGAGDSLQYMKAGVVEIPHLAVVTKADMGVAARRAAADLKGALSLVAAAPGGEQAAEVAVLLCSASSGEGVPDLAAALIARARAMTCDEAAARRRTRHCRAWLHGMVAARFGAESLPYLRDDLAGTDAVHAPFQTVQRAMMRAAEALRVGFAPH